MISQQLDLFAETVKKPRDCVRDGPCLTCGAVRPDGYERTMFLEPVSHECGACNRKTLDEILYGDWQTRAAAWARHHRGVTGKRPGRTRRQGVLFT